MNTDCGITHTYATLHAHAFFFHEGVGFVYVSWCGNMHLWMLTLFFFVLEITLGFHTWTEYLAVLLVRAAWCEIFAYYLLMLYTCVFLLYIILDVIVAESCRETIPRSYD